MLSACASKESLGTVATDSSAKISLDGIFGMIQQNDDLFDVMNVDRDDDGNQNYIDVLQRSSGMVE